jgi:hypothetical protein
MSKAKKIIAAKRRWVETTKTPRNALERHVAIRDANDSLQPYVAATRVRLERELSQHEARRRADAILDSREYSFCLFPRAHFERLLLDGG